MPIRKPPPRQATRPPADFSAHKAEQAQRTRMMRLALPAVAPLVLLAVLCATRLMDTSQADQPDYWAAAALVALLPVAVVLLLNPRRAVRRAGYGLVLAIDLTILAVGLRYGSKSAWFYGAAGLFALAAGYTLWALTRDRPPAPQTPADSTA
ncbi:MAG: hypothetical protein ACREJ2_02325 [Planctomycetota bacterium]